MIEFVVLFLSFDELNNASVFLVTAHGTWLASAKLVFDLHTARL